MPEGPQARQVADIIERYRGFDIIEIRHPASRKPWDLPLPDQIERVETKGKNIFIYLASGGIIYNHMLMWGWWLPTIEVVTKKRLNTAFITTGGNFGYFGGGVIKLITPEEADKLKRGLGPDMLTVTSADEAFSRVKTNGLPLGEALLEQSLIAGIGNVYKSEGLFIGRVHPLRPASTITEAEYDRIFNWLQPQMVGDIKRPGKMITTSREAARAGHPNFVYRRLGQPCLLCNTKIQRIYQGERLKRSTYFCPRCQALDKT